MYFYYRHNELSGLLHAAFRGKVTSMGVDPDTKMGAQVAEMIEKAVAEAMSRDEIAAIFIGDRAGEAKVENLEAMFDNIILLGEQMAADAIEERSSKLLEWSLYSARQKLAPLYPFFNEPYDN